MDWKERFKPSNTAEIGCLVFFVVAPLFLAAIFLGVEDYIPHVAMSALLLVYAYRIGLLAYEAYDVTKRTAFIVTGMLVLTYFLLWLGILVALVSGFSNIISQAMGQLFFVFGIILAVALYFHLIRFKQTIYEKWLGWHPRKEVADG